MQLLKTAARVVEAVGSEILMDEIQRSSTKQALSEVLLRPIRR